MTPLVLISSYLVATWLFSETRNTIHSSDSSHTLSRASDVLLKSIPHSHTAATSQIKHKPTCKYKCILSLESTMTYKHTGSLIPQLISIPWLSSLVQVGHLESGGRLNLSTLLIVTIWQQTYKGQNTTSFPLKGLGRAWLIPPGTEVTTGTEKGKLQSSSGLVPDYYQEWIRIQLTVGLINVRILWTWLLSIVASVWQKLCGMDFLQQELVLLPNTCCMKYYILETFGVFELWENI